MKSKPIVDIFAFLCVIIALISGLMLHSEIHHKYIYHDVLWWTIHSLSSIMLVLLLLIHSVQHKFLFINYFKIPVPKKRVTTILFLILIVLIISGIVLLLGSHSNFISLLHFCFGLIFTCFTIGHMMKRFKIFTGLLFQ
jgi:hypothetical protein